MSDGNVRNEPIPTTLLLDLPIPQPQLKEERKTLSLIDLRDLNVRAFSQHPSVNDKADALVL